MKLEFDIKAWLHEREIPFNEMHLSLRETPLRFADEHGIDPIQVMKTAFLRIDGNPWLVVLPAHRAVAPERVKQALDARDVVELPMEVVHRYVPEHQQIDAACAFGSRLGLPVLLDEPLTLNADVVVPTGDGDQFLEMRLADYLELEQPNVEEIGDPITVTPIGGETTANVPAPEVPPDVHL